MGPIDTAPLFGPLHEQLIALLRSLTAEQWLRQTIARRWRVRDVAAHLLDGDLRQVSVYRDGHVLPVDAPIASPQDLARFVNDLNASGVRYAERLSPRQIVDLLAITGRWVTEVVAALPPHGRAIWPVSWAGEAESENWMDTGRQYTERWHHQMQIRDAVGRPLLLEPQWLDPLLDISVRALPMAYAATPAEDGTAVRLEVDGDEPRAWTLVHEAGHWAIGRGAVPEARCTVRGSADAVWRLLFNALPSELARTRLHVFGDRALAEPLIHARSVVV